MKSIEHQLQELGFPDDVVTFGDIADSILQRPTYEKCQWFVDKLKHANGRSFLIGHTLLAEFDMFLEFYLLLAQDCWEREQE